MEIRYDITEEAYLEFNVYHAKKSKSVRKTITIQRVVMPILYLLMAFIFSSILDLPILVLLIPLFLIGMLWAIFYPAYFYRHIRRTAQKMVREGKSEGMLGNRTMIFTEEGLREISSTGEKTQTWFSIEKIGEDDSNFYLFNSGMSAYIVPKQNMVDVEGIRSFLLSKVDIQA